MHTMFEKPVHIILILVLLVFFGCAGKNKHVVINEAIINGGFETEAKKLTGWNLEARHSNKELPYRADGEPSATLSGTSSAWHTLTEKHPV